MKRKEGKYNNILANCFLHHNSNCARIELNNITTKRILAGVRFVVLVNPLSENVSLIKYFVLSNMSIEDENGRYHILCQE